MWLRNGKKDLEFLHAEKNSTPPLLRRVATANQAREPSIKRDPSIRIDGRNNRVLDVPEIVSDSVFSIGIHDPPDEKVYLVGR